MSTQPNTYLSPEEYLEADRRAERKSEYYAGEMFAMAGASYAHNRLVSRVIRDVGQQLRSGRCEALPSDMRVAVNPTGLYTYPDVTVVCGEPQFLDERRDTLLNPTLIVEVLSPSTEGYDRGRKFQHYRSLESLQEYVLIASDRVQVEVFRRQAGGQWLLIAAGGKDDVIELQSIQCRLPLAALYEGVEVQG